MWDYSDKVREHYLHPHNVGEVQNPDGVGEIGNIKCGDALRLTFKLDENQRIQEIKFKTFGCGSAIASSSVLTDLCVGKTLEEAAKITNKDIADALGGLPPAKMHCSVMGQEALEAAIHFYNTGGKETTVPAKQGTIVCTCFSVTDKEIEEAIRHNGLTTVEQITNYTKAGGGCGGCVEQIQQILDSVLGTSSQSSIPQPPPRMTTLEKIDKIKQVLTEDINPILARDQGGCELVDIDGNEVFVRFTGHCKGCAFSQLTQKSVVEDMMRKKVHPDLIVVEAK
jgi:NifU-like protein